MKEDLQPYLLLAAVFVLAISGVGIARFLFFRPIGAWSTQSQIEYCLRAAHYGIDKASNFEQRVFDLCIAKGWSYLNEMPKPEMPPKQEPLFEIPPLTPEMLESMEPVVPNQGS